MTRTDKLDWPQQLPLTALDSSTELTLSANPSSPFRSFAGQLSLNGPRSSPKVLPNALGTSPHKPPREQLGYV